MRGSHGATPELLGHVQHRYEETDEAVASIAADCDLTERTVYKWVVQHGWRRRRDRPPRDLPPDVRLSLDVERAMQETEFISPGKGEVARTPLRTSGWGSKAQTSRTVEMGVQERPLPGARSQVYAGCVNLAAFAPTSPFQGEVQAERPCLPSLGNSTVPQTAEGGEGQPCRGHETADDASFELSDPPSIADRLERQLEQNLTRVERMRETQWPQGAADAERTTRVLERLTQALLKVRQLRNPGANTAGKDDFDMPRDIDEFRRALARRIDAFVRSRTGAGVSGPGESRGAG